MASMKKREPTYGEKSKISDAACTGDLNTIDVLVSSNVDVTGGLEWDQRTALHMAASNGRYNVVAYLLSHGARVNDVDSYDKWTPLHCAAYNGHAEIADLLVKNKANISMKDRENKTPLQLAVERGKSDLVYFFVKQQKMDITQFDDEMQRKIDDLVKRAEEKQGKTTTVLENDKVSSTYKSEAVTQLQQLQLDHNTELTATANKPYNTDRIDKLEKALVEIQMSNEYLQNQLLLNQEQLSNIQSRNDHLQDQLSTTKQQLSDVQTTNGHLQNQLSLTQQQLLGIQSMMTCSRLWVVSHDQFTIGREIGRGAWATVHETKFRGATIAAKRLHHLITSPKTRELFSREMEMALHCQHQNIVTFLGATLEGPPVMLMELMSTSLRSAYEQGNIKDHQVLGILHDIARALHFLHTRPDPVIHRDVSSANVLLKALYNGEWLAKLGDLGTAKIQKQAATAGPGAIAYGAPEAADFTKHSPKMDVYSYGVLMLEVLTKTHPFQMVDALKVQVQQQFPQYYQLVITCISQQSRYRPTMYDVIEQLDRARP